MNRDSSERCDIVIPVWNHLEMTNDCVDSIKKHTSYPYRLIIVDNASGTPTREYLDSLKKGSPNNVVIIRNEENKGFTKAVNQGMRFSDAAYICIMNNDTTVAKGWLEEMIEILHRNNDIGIINPSSNTSGQFPGKLSIEAYARGLVPLRGEYQELYTGRAFAMVVKRKIIEEIGYLDEIYGMGYFDDTDYCKRAQQLGYKVVRAKASYVYHKESQSFSKIKEKSAIFLENENKFVSRWGRYLRVAYVLPGSSDAVEIKNVSSNINRMAKMGHQVWTFTKSNFGPILNVIDHESIRFLYYPNIFFSPIIFYKIWKRKKKKRMHVILTNNCMVYRLFGFLKNVLGADIFMDKDFSAVEKRLSEMSRYGDLRKCIDLPR